MIEHVLVWGGLLALGAFHSLNPGMGWLFAVALGMQEERQAAVLRALLPLTIGHGLAVAAVTAAALALGDALPPSALKAPLGATLLALGAYRVWRHRHPRGGGLRVGVIGLTTWSFLMASCHGGGLMVLPLVLHWIPDAHGAGCHTGSGTSAMTGLAAAALHGAGYLAATGLAALTVFRKLGLGLLRRAWFNVDLLWALALIAAGAIGLIF